MPFSGETRPAISARRATGTSGGSNAGTPFGRTSTPSNPAAVQARRIASDTVAQRAPERLAAASTAGTRGGRWSVCSTGRPAASSMASASKACCVTASQPAWRTTANRRSNAARRPGGGFGGGPPGITSAASTPAGAGTVTRLSPATDEPSAQNTVTS